MAYDEGLAQRIREHLDERSDVEEKRMFGGLAFMVRGSLAFGIVKEELMVHVGPDDYDAAVKKKYARPMTFTGKALKSMVYVGAAGFEEDADLERWLERGLAFNATLDAKAATKKAAKKKTAKKKAAK